ncbi:unannotated protein [freshwater metagenome]|uniref:Unannotated protein n=1 Tax=freshwater metagenome TaxID=449393 RepID=A0A6J7N1B5_9ZZZZ
MASGRPRAFILAQFATESGEFSLISLIPNPDTLLLEPNLGWSSHSKWLFLGDRHSSGWFLIRGDISSWVLRARLLFFRDD